MSKQIFNQIPLKTGESGSTVLTTQFGIRGLTLNNTSNASFKIYVGAVSVGMGNNIPDFTVSEYTFASLPINGNITKITIEWTAPTIVRDDYIRVDLTEEKTELRYSGNPPSTIGTGQIDNVTIIGGLPAGSNHIGTVGIDGGITVTVQNEVEVKNDAGNPVPVTGNITIIDMPPILVTDEPIRLTHQSWEDVVGDTVVTFDMGTDNVNRIVYIENFGTTDVYISFDAVTPTAAIANGLNGIFKIRAGRAITDITRQFTKLNMIRPSGAADEIVSFLGV